MDSQGSQEEPQVNRKTPIESLSKEDLIKKYRQAIIIAQKAKESKGDLIKQYSEHEKVLKSLEERLQKCEDEKTKEADLRAGLEHELNDAKDLIESLKEIKDKQEVLDNLNSKINNLENQVEVYKMAIDEKSCKSESQEIENNKTIDHLREEILRKDEELSMAENTITELSTKLQDAKENLANLKQPSDLLSKIDLLESENSTISDKLAYLESELAVTKNDKSGEEKDQRILDLESQVRELQNKVSKQEELLERERETNILLESQVKHFTSVVEDNAKCIEALKKENMELQNDIIQRDEAMQKKCEEYSKQSSQILNLENELSAVNREMSDMIGVMEKLKDQLKESDDNIKSSEARHLSSIQIEQELRVQVTSLQAVLSGKDKLIQDLEQELSKLKDFAANESTNTEVSSTFSLSRSEELSRMKDLEDSFEDKYTKLRVVAVKLKKRVTELTQTLEMERSKMVTEKLDLQAKLTQLASHAKTVQTLQNEVDRLQDLVEEQKKQQQQLTKDLELAVRESAQKKVELAAVQEELHHTANEKKSLEASLSSLTSNFTQFDGLQTEIDQLQRELKEKDNILESFKEQKQLLSEQLEKVCVDAKKKSVLSLEMADMEKSVSELTRQLASERDRLKNSENEVEQGRLSLSCLQDKLEKIENSLADKEIENNKLHEKLSLAKEESENLNTKLKEKAATAAQLSNDLEKQRSLVEELNIQCSNLAAKQVQAEELARRQIDSLSRQVFQLEEHSSALKGSHKTLEDELALVKTEFENYKVRAQNVLRQSTKQEDRIISSSTCHNAEELEVEVERLRVNVSNLKENLKLTTSQLQAALQDVVVEREEKICAIKQAQASKELYTQAIERQHASEERLSVVLEESKQAKLHSDMLLQCYKQQIEDLKSTHQKKIASLTEQMENLQASITTPVVQPVESDQTSSVQSGPSPVAEWAVNLSNTTISDPDLAMRLSSLQREEGEGSESVESFPSRRISVTTQGRRHELVPLEKLLSSSTYPEDDSPEIARTNSSDLDVDLLQSKLSACESRASHLTALLSEAESDAARLSQLNAVLKEEIRRQQRSEERAQHAHNLEYLKNIVVKFITLQNGDERQRLVPVLNTILKLSPEEANLVATVAKGATQGNASSRGWGSYLPLPGWTGS